MLSNIAAGGALGPWKLAAGGANMAETNQKNQFSDFYVRVFSKVSFHKVLEQYTNIEHSVTLITLTLQLLQFEGSYNVMYCFWLSVYLKTASYLKR